MKLRKQKLQGQSDGGVGEEPSTSAPKSSNSKKRAIILVVLAAIIIGAIGIALYMSNKNSEDTIAGGACSDRSEGAILLRAGEEINSSESNQIDITKVDAIVTEIKQLPNYGADPNCLYPLVQSRVLHNDFEAAKTELDKFMLAYGAGDTFASDVYNLYDVESYKNQITKLYEVSKLASPDASSGFFSIPEEQEVAE